jgi:uncharacterized membrane protein
MQSRRATELVPPVERLRTIRGARVVSIVIVLVALACNGSGDLPLDQVDPDAVPANPTYDQVFAILHNRCVTCHTGADDGGDDDGGYSVSRLRTTADVDPDLSDCVEIVALRDDILRQVEDNLMPPGAMPRLTNEQKLLIRRWVDNGAPAPCN